MAVTAVTIARSLFTQQQYFVFQKLADGRYVRYTLEVPVGATADSGGAYTDFFPVAKVDVGTVRPGKWQNYTRRSGIGGTWSAVPDNGWDFYAATENEYLEWDIPDGHNRIHLFTKNRSTYGTLGISWDDDTTTGLDLTAVDTSETPGGVGINGVREYVLATTSTATSRTLKVKVTSAAACYLAGIHSFDTDGTGDPSTVNGSDSLAEGHDFVDILDHTDTLFKCTNLPVGSDMVNIGSDNIIGFAIIWAPNGEVDSVTATGSAHYNVSTNDAPLTMFAGPELFVGGATKGSMASIADIPLGEIHTDNRISIDMTGYGAFTSKKITDITPANPAVVTSTAHGYSNGDVVRISGVIGTIGADVVNGNSYTIANKTDDTFELAACDTSGKAYTSSGRADLTVDNLLQMTINQTFGPGGMGLSAALDWTGNCDCETAYNPLFAFVSGLTGIATFPPDDTEYPFTVGDEVEGYDQESNSISILLKDKDLKIDVTSVQPVSHIWEQSAGTKLKLQCQIDVAAMAGGINPNGDHWTIGGFISIQSLTGGGYWESSGGTLILNHH